MKLSAIVFHVISANIFIEAVCACSKEFLNNIRVCLREVDGMPSLHRNPIIHVPSWDKLEAYCRRNVSRRVTRCMDEFYKCPAHVQMQRKCNMASVFPEVLVRRLKLTCKVKDKLREDLVCVNNRSCIFSSCLGTVPRISDELSTSILGWPRGDDSCMFLDRVRFCYELHLRHQCSDATVDFIIALLDTYKPPSCLRGTALLSTSSASYTSSGVGLFLLTLSVLVCLL